MWGSVGLYVCVVVYSYMVQPQAMTKMDDLWLNQEKKENRPLRKKIQKTLKLDRLWANLTNQKPWNIKLTNSSKGRWCHKAPFSSFPFFWVAVKVQQFILLILQLNICVHSYLTLISWCFTKSKDVSCCCGCNLASNCCEAAEWQGIWKEEIRCSWDWKVSCNPIYDYTLYISRLINPRHRIIL